MTVVNVSETLPIAVVIPVRNESSRLDELFDALLRLSPRPAQIVFVDTGSVDGSAARVSQWMGIAARAGLIAVQCSRPGAYPGAARNAGIEKATEEWIAFLDVGIAPKPDWLGALWACQLKTGAEAVYGCCTFGADAPLGRMLCAVSYGVGRQAPVLPASMFRRRLFERIGLFETSLRAGEDILWKRALLKSGIDLPVCPQALVEYRHFSPTVWQAAHKQFIYEQNAALAGIGGGARALALFGHLLLYPALLVAWPVALPLLGSYWVLRGVIDPVRRSGRWWSAPWQVAALPVVTAMLDLAAVGGRVVAWLGMSRFRREPPPRLDALG